SARDCSISIESNGAPVPDVINGILSDRICFNCSRPGHIAAACPEISQTNMRDVICYW
ncbi:unnamed protein product, partial [Rotaria magnacalcarata]